MTQAFLQWCVRVSVVFLKVLLRFFALMAFFFVALVTGTLRARVTSMMAWCVMMQKMDSLRICCRTMKRALNRWLFFGMVFEKMTFSLKELGETEIERMGGSFWFVKRKVQRNWSPKAWVVVSNMCYFQLYLGKWSNWTHIFQMGWFNHQLVCVWFILAFMRAMVRTMSERSGSSSLYGSSLQIVPLPRHVLPWMAMASPPVETAK